MSHLENDKAFEQFWHDKDTADRMMLVGQWAESFTAYFIDAWDEFEEDILHPSGYYPNNVWTMDAERQEIFIDYLTAKDDAYGFNSWLEERFKEAVEPGWGVGEAE